MTNISRQPAFIYTYAYNDAERSLCHLEMRSFFGKDTELKILKSDIKIDPNRSPFMKGRLDILADGDEVEEIIAQASAFGSEEETNKVIFLKINDRQGQDKIENKERLQIERAIGSEMQGDFDLHNPDQLYAIVPFGGRWYFGLYCKSEPIWFHHMKKPKEYSTALSTRVARAVANIAVPHPEGIRAIDPCCGIGTVLVEALSMGIDIVGRDINPLVCVGSRENIAYFGLTGDVQKGAIEDITETYDVAIIDLPYNLYTHASWDEQFEILKHARRIAKKVVIVTIESMDERLKTVGFQITDRCITKKQQFSREIVVCQ
ncbi:TRM11 family methyltransferase [Psychrobacillus sp. FJAT-21963]|uniref:TRM11 family SAM-dependent methyltransferase n=1 Tax=Psychrobacillus sp. FJAT-21963 TaxID=1712028 RepID=UPI0006FB297E|nr:RsmD family RNA methyltransferase [Psychrobacillus sp. FJAT-21963]KQL34646.1 RNA methyltransferase [Psychrobacillus sp. FJAT-21963]